MRTLTCGDTATMTLGVLYNEGYAPCAEADGFIDNFTTTGIALARTLFAVVPKGAQDATERWSPERSIALCERCRDALDGAVEPPFLADFERADSVAETPATEEAPLPTETPAPDAAADLAAPANQPPAPKFCYSCGSPLAPGVRFCSHCGTQVAQ